MDMSTYTYHRWSRRKGSRNCGGRHLSKSWEVGPCCHTAHLVLPAERSGEVLAGPSTGERVSDEGESVPEVSNGGTKHVDSLAQRNGKSSAPTRIWKFFWEATAVTDVYDTRRAWLMFYVSALALLWRRRPDAHPLLTLRRRVWCSLHRLTWVQAP